MAVETRSKASVPGDGPLADTPHVEPLGNFPFPILSDGKESRQMVWVRNHANYLANRGWLDYVRAISLILRGVIVNMMIGLPVLLIVALFVALLSVNNWGFAAALTFVIAALVWVVMSPILTRLWSILRLQNTLALGSSSSVKIRDRFERSFGAFLILTVAVASVESLSFFLDDFHLWVRERDWGGPEVASLGTFTVGMFASAGRLLPRLGGKAKNAVILVVGLVGVLVPIGIIMLLADFLAFGGPTAQYTVYVAIAGFVLAFIMTTAFIVVLWKSAFRLRDNVIAAIVLLVSLVVFGLFLVAADGVQEADSELRGELMVLDLNRQVREKNLTVEMSERAPEEVSLLSDFVVDAEALQTMPDPATLPPLSDNYLSLDDDQLAWAQNADFQLELLVQSAEYIPSVGHLVDRISSDGSFSQTPTIRPEDLAYLAAELDLLEWRVADLAQVLDDGPETPRVMQGVISAPLWRPADFGFDDSAQVALGNQLRADSHAMRADGEDMIAQGEAMFLNADNSPEGDELALQGLDIEYLGYERLIWADEMMYLGEDLVAGEEMLYWEGYLGTYANNDVLAPAPIGASLTSYEYPTLADLFSLEFSNVSFEIWQLEQDFLEAREEIARSAVFSSQFSEILDNPAVGDIRRDSLQSSATFALMLAVVISAYAWLAVDPNRTSLHGMYRDRLAAAFLVGIDKSGDVDIEDDLDLHELSRHEAGSIAPYHLINVALNLQASKDISIHDRSSDFFIFSKRFIGGERTGYCRSDTMERVFPEMSLSTAMAVSAAAAAPNMGRTTKPGLVAFMTMLNVRLGLWMPNPGLLEAEIGMEPKPEPPPPGSNRPRGFTSKEVIDAERFEVQRRWDELGSGRTFDEGLVGLAFSGGGIRSATINLGLTQVLHSAGVFDQVDYMSTVSGGGYLGSSISTAMRSRELTRAQVTSAAVEIRTEPDGHLVVNTPPSEPGFWSKRFRIGREPHTSFTYRPDAVLGVHSGQGVNVGQRLLVMRDRDVLQENRATSETAPETSLWRRGGGAGSFGDQYRWRVRPTALLYEMVGRLHEGSKSINVSDGGHIENLAVIELMRRRCKYIICGDGGMDINHNFDALTFLIRTARVEFGIELDIQLDQLRLNDEKLSPEHWVTGTINYPRTEDHPEPQTGHFLYIKSSLTGDEDEDIVGYRKSNPNFPHQSTADQFFDEGQFESYRLLGQHIGERLVNHLPSNTAESIADVETWFKKLHSLRSER